MKEERQPQDSDERDIYEAIIGYTGARDLEASKARAWKATDAVMEAMTPKPKQTPSNFEQMTRALLECLLMLKPNRENPKLDNSLLEQTWLLISDEIQAAERRGSLSVREN